MKFIVKLFPEITIKSDSVRLRFIKILTSNIRNILKHHLEGVAVLRHWDYIEVRSKHVNDEKKIADLLTKIPGIHHILAVETLPFTDMHSIFEHTLQHYGSQIENKTFCVRVKRRGQHGFTSLEVERYVGGGLNQHVVSAKVKLTRPDITVHLEIEDNTVLLVKHRYCGLGGFPIGTQEDVLSLISGGYDSGVSSYMLLRRGCRVHYCFFNLGGKSHETGVKQMAYSLWQRYGSSHKVRFIAVDFSHVISEILEKIEDGQMGVILKRMMIRAAAHIANRYRINALVTGEALGQVSSQTLSNLRLIDTVSEVLVLRPLIAYDKETIIQLARTIGTEEIAKSMPEFCGVISKKPTIKAVKETILSEESKFDFTVLDASIANAISMDIHDIAKITPHFEHNIAVIQTPGKNDVIIDIRSHDDQEEYPLVISGTSVLTIPFYKLGGCFSELDPSKQYWLYCDQGVMSKLQAAYLHELGFKNIGIFKKSN